MTRELLQIHAIFRHGHRTPEDIVLYPKHESNGYYPYGPSQLTNLGKRCMYDLGKLLRDRYNEFLGDIYLPQEVEAWSSEFDRAKASLALALAGLYPPKKDLIWNDELHWQPIPSKYVLFNNDKVFGQIVSKEYRTAYNKNFNESTYAKNLMEKHRPLLSYLEEKTGMKIDNTFRCYIVYTTLYSEKTYGNDLPDWMDQVKMEELKQLVDAEFGRMMIDTVELKRMAGGYLLQKITNDIQAKIDGKSAKKIVVYSGHDVNIMSFLCLFDMMFPHWPGYGACIVVEVYKTDTGYEIEILYRDESDSTLKMRTFPDGLKTCTLANWKKVLDVYGPIEDREVTSSLKDRIHL